MTLTVSQVTAAAARGSGPSVALGSISAKYQSGAQDTQAAANDMADMSGHIARRALSISRDCSRNIKQMSHCVSRVKALVSTLEEDVNYVSKVIKDRSQSVLVLGDNRWFSVNDDGSLNDGFRQYYRVWLTRPFYIGMFPTYVSAQKQAEEHCLYLQNVLHMLTEHDSIIAGKIRGAAIMLMGDPSETGLPPAVLADLLGAS
jgi:hypothetical protein